MQEMIEKGMVKVEDSARVRELMHTMLNGDVYTSLQAVGNLGAIGAPAVGPLVQALLAADSDARWTVAMALARTGAEAVEPLIGLLLVVDDELKNPVVWALAEIGDPRAVDPLVGVLRTSQSECCRALTAAALLKLGDPAGIAEVEKAFEQSGEAFTGLAMEAYEGT